MNILKLCQGRITRAISKYGDWPPKHIGTDTLLNGKQLALEGIQEKVDFLNICDAEVNYYHSIGDYRMENFWLRRKSHSMDELIIILDKYTDLTAEEIIHHKRQTLNGPTSKKDNSQG